MFNRINLAQLTLRRLASDPVVAATYLLAWHKRFAGLPKIMLSQHIEDTARVFCFSYRLPCAVSSDFGFLSAVAVSQCPTKSDVHRNISLELSNRIMCSSAHLPATIEPTTGGAERYKTLCGQTVFVMPRQGLGRILYVGCATSMPSSMCADR